MEHLHDDDVVVMPDLIGVRRRRAHMLGGDLPFMTMLITNVMVVAM